jgi:hypothetical protein
VTDDGNVAIRLGEVTLGDGKITGQNIDAFCDNFADMSRICGDTPIGGLIPVSFFGDRQVEIDLPNHVLRLRRAGTPLPAEAVALDCTRYPRDSRPYARLTVGDRRVEVLLDTGDYGVQIPAWLLEGDAFRLEGARPSFSSYRERAYEAVRGTAGELGLGEFSVRGAEVIAIQLGRPRGFVGGGKRDPFAVIGMPVLKHWTLIYDPRSKPLSIVGPRVVEKAAPDPRASRVEEDASREAIKRQE